MAVRLQIRRGTQAEWLQQNPLLMEGEMAVELDTQFWKVGNGVDNYVDLPYAPVNNLEIGEVKDGTNASATITGSPPLQKLNLTLPRGYQGIQGPEGPQGEQGEPGYTPQKGIDYFDGLDVTWKDTYDAEIQYQVNDAIFYEGSSYICILESLGNLPTNTMYFNIMAQQGQAGTGDMLASVYDPDGKQANAFDYENFKNTPTFKTINNTSILGNGNITTPNTTYSEITDAEINAGTASTIRGISGRRAKKIIDNAKEGKQDKLVSGTNIKTINGTTLLGSGNIEIEGGGGDVVGPSSSVDKTLAVFDGTSGKLIKNIPSIKYHDGYKQDYLNISDVSIGNVSWPEQDFTLWYKTVANLDKPRAARHAATKEYVDDILSGYQIQKNGTDGVGIINFKTEDDGGGGVY